MGAGEKRASSEAGMGTNTAERLRLAHEGVDSHPQDNPDFARGTFQEGWNDLIEKRLTKYLEKA